MNYEVWMEGYRDNGGGAGASFMGTYEAEDFLSACKMAVKKHGDQKLYNPERNTIWGCHLYDNELDARKYFG